MPQGSDSCSSSVGGDAGAWSLTVSEATCDPQMAISAVDHPAKVARLVLTVAVAAAVVAVAVVMVRLMMAALY